MYNTGKLYFEYFLLKEFIFEDMSSDSAVPGLNREIAESLEQVIPEVEVICRFNEFCEPLFTKINIKFTISRTYVIRSSPN